MIKGICNNECKNCNVKLPIEKKDIRYGGWIYSYYCPFVGQEVGIEGISGIIITPLGKVIKGFYQTKQSSSQE